VTFAPLVLADAGHVHGFVTDRAYTYDPRLVGRPKKWRKQYRIEAGRLEPTRDELVSAPIAHNAAIEYATSQLAVLESELQVEVGARNRLLACLRAALAEDSVFPTIVSDGADGATAEWRAGARLLALETNSDGEYSLVAVNENGLRTVNEVGQDKPSLDYFASLVRLFTNYVRERNPGWRSQYV
jgi:hypothetical protein